MKKAGIGIALLVGIWLPATLLACQSGTDQKVDPFPQMTSPSTEKGGVRGHIYGNLDVAVLCDVPWSIPGEALDLGEPQCQGTYKEASIDGDASGSQRGLYYFANLDAGRYWLMAKRRSVVTGPWSNTDPEGRTTFTLLEYSGNDEGYIVDVEAGLWTDVPSFDLREH